MQFESITGLFGAWAATLCAFLLTFYHLRRRNKWRNFPPGPRGLPLVGYLPFVGKNPPKTYAGLSKVYGPIISVDIGPKTWVILNDYDSIHEALVKNGNAFSGRPRLELLHKITQGHGIIFKDFGDEFKSQRKFALTTLRGFGVGKRSMEDRIMEEAGYFAEVIKAENEKPFNCQPAIVNAVSNIICSITMGSRFSYDDKDFVEMTGRLNRGFREDALAIAIVTFVSSAKYFPPFSGAYERLFDDVRYVLDELRKILEEHKKTIDFENTRDFIDEYLKEMTIKKGKDSSFHELQLFQLIRDFFLAGTETTSSTLRWCVLAFAYFPHIQGNVAKEIRQVIGDGVPSMKHRDAMPYTCAFLQEILRHRTLTPLAVPHKTSCNVTLRGFEIPKDTPVLANIWAVHHDPSNFENPEEFRPERFLDDNGCFVQDKHVIPFSVGPRYCLGEQLAKMELFLFLTSIVQKFEIVPDDDKPLPDFNFGSQGFAEVPLSFEVAFKQR